MADNIVAGLFGLDPIQQRMQSIARDQAAAAQFATMTPQQQSDYGIGIGASGMIRGAAPMLGLVNPQEQQSQQNTATQSQINHQTPEGLLKGAQLFNQAGNPRMAYQYSQAAQAMQAQQAKIAQETATARNQNAQALKALTAEDKISAFGQQLKDAGIMPGTPEFLAEMRKYWEAEVKNKAKEGGTQPVTPVTIQDPNDPNGTIIIDGRTKSVIGKGPKLSQLGSVEQKLAVQMPVAKQQAEIALQNMDRLDKSVNTLVDHKGLSGITGLVYGNTPNVTDAARSAQAQLDSLKSQIFVTALQSMRAQSKTGGAVGNVSNREGDKLEATLGALKQNQGTKDFQEQLKKVAQQVKQSKDAIQGAYEEQFGHLPGYKPLGSKLDTTTPPAEDAAPKVEKWTRNAAGQLVRVP